MFIKKNNNNLENDYVHNPTLNTLTTPQKLIFLIKHQKQKHFQFHQKINIQKSLGITIK